MHKTIKRTMALLTVLCMVFLSSPSVYSAEGNMEEGGAAIEETAGGQTESGQTGAEDQQDGQGDTEGTGAEGHEGTDPGNTNEETENNDNNDSNDSNENEDEDDEADETEEDVITGMDTGDTVSYTSKLETTGSSDMEIRVFTVNNNGTKYEGACAQIGVKALKRGNASVTRVSNDSRHAKLIYKYAVEMDWWRGPEGEKSARSELGVDFSVKTTKRKLVEYMNQISRQGSAWKDAAVEGAGMTSSFANTIYRYVTGRDVSDVTVPDNFELYYCVADSGQNFTVWRFTRGEITSTAARDKSSGSKNMAAGCEGTIVDTVSYQGLSPGSQYSMRAEVYDRTDQKMLDAYAEAELPGDDTSGSIDMEIRLDTEGLEDHSLVVYESLMENGTVVSRHSDPDNRDQTVYVPEIQTEATDAETGSHISNVCGSTTIIDRVSYKNLVPGQTYMMSGTLMDKDSGSAFTANGSEVTASLTFTPDEADGCVQLEFTFDSRGCEGMTAVAFEECSVNGSVIAVHRDIDDEAQSVRFPALSTEAGRHADGFIIDNVSYENLLPGMTYTVRGVLIDKKSGKTISGSEGETTFTAEGPSGCVEVVLEPGASKGSLVAFETLYIEPDIEPGHEGPEDTNGIQIAEHKDINCEAQTVSIQGDAPETGDHGVLGAWMAGMISAGLLLAIMIIRRIRSAG